VTLKTRKNKGVALSFLHDSLSKKVNLGNSKGSDSGGAWGVVTLSLPTGDDMAIRYTARPTRIGTSFFASLTVLLDDPVDPPLLPVRAALSRQSPSARRRNGGNTAGRRAGADPLTYYQGV